MSSQKASVGLASAALIIAVFGATPVGEATVERVTNHKPSDPPAYRARNAFAVGGIKASRSPKAGFLYPLGAGAKFPRSVLPAVVGPQGPPGAKGDKGDPGAPGVVPPPPPAIPAAFGAGWSDWSGPEFEGVSYWKDAFGVHLRGLAMKVGPGGPVLGDVIFTLPPGYRPAEILIFVVQSGAPDGVGRVDIAPDGTVKWISGQTGHGCCGDYTSLSGIDFRPA